MVTKKKYVKKRKYHTITCKRCGIEKQVRSDTHQIYCSVSCQSKDSWALGKIKATSRGAVKTQICPKCQKEFYGYACNGKIYCSTECRLEGLKVVRKCKHCGIEFKVLKSAIEHTNASGNYCSIECYYNHGRKKATCLKCSKVIEVKKHKKGLFCSHICALTFHSKERHYRWVGPENKHSTRGNGWLVIRKRVLERDGYKCNNCHINVIDNSLNKGSAPNVANVHHIVPYRISKDNSLINLITLCPSCHMKIEWSGKGRKHMHEIREDTNK